MLFHSSRCNCDCHKRNDHYHYYSAKWTSRLLQYLAGRHQSANKHEQSIEDEREKLEHLLKFAKEELDCANESYGSVYYEGDVLSAKEAVQEYMERYQHVVKQFGESNMDEHFRLAASNLQTQLKSLPEEEEEKM